MSCVFNNYTMCLSTCIIIVLNKAIDVTLGTRVQACHLNIVKIDRLNYRITLQNKKDMEMLKGKTA